MAARVVAKIGWAPRARCVPAVISWNWFFNRRPRGRRNVGR
jgi:hypothetical protein